MEIILNGKPHPLDQEITVQELLESLQLTEQRLAVEINLELIPRSTFSDVTVKADDKVEIVGAIGGG